MSEKDIDIPSLSLEDLEIPEQEIETVENKVYGSTNYSFIGSGQGGCRIAQEFYKLGYRKTIGLNTSSQDLSHTDLPENHKLLLDIGPGGAGKDMFKGETAVVKYSQEIYDLMKKIIGRTDHVMICVCAGGGSGGGSVIPLIMVVKKYLRYLGYFDDIDQRVGVIITIPRNGEMLSLRVASNAYSLMSKISGMAEKKSITPTVVVDNERIQKIYRGLTVSKFWPTVNSSVAGLFDIFNRLSIQHSPYTSFDPTDYRNVVTAGGHCIFGVTKVTGLMDDAGIVDETQISHSLKSNLEKTLLASGFDLGTAESAASIVVGGEQLFDEVAGLQEAIEYAFDTLANLTGDATVHRGIYQDQRDSLRVYTFIGGLKRPSPRYGELRGFAREKYPEKK